MARIRQSVSPRLGLALVNSLIKGNPIEQDIIDWKTKHSNNTLSTLGQNFSSMYRHNTAEMEEPAIVVIRNIPAWMDCEGNIVDKGSASGCQVTHAIVRPDYCIVADEIGNNISMKGGGHICGQMYLCAKGSISQKKASTKDTHFTTLGLNLLTGEPLMCVVMIQGILIKADYWTGVDMLADTVVNEGNADFYKNNLDPGNIFPGGPLSIVRGKVVPCMVRFQLKGGMPSIILKDILETLGDLNIFPRVDRLKPIFLVDGHGSRLELPFLDYVNNPEHL